MFGIAPVGARAAGLAFLGAATAVAHLPVDRRVVGAVEARVEEHDLARDTGRGTGPGCGNPWNHRQAQQYRCTGRIPEHVATCRAPTRARSVRLAVLHRATLASKPLSRPKTCRIVGIEAGAL